MEKDHLTIAAEISTIVGTIIVLLAFFGLYKVLDLVKIFRYLRNLILIKRKNIRMVSLKGNEISSEWDRDYLIINNKKAHWIKNYSTLLRIMKEHSNVSDINSKKEYVKLPDFAKFEMGHAIDIEWQTV